MKSGKKEAIESSELGPGRNQATTADIMISC